MADQDNDVVKIDYREVGATGLKRFSGFIFEEFLRELTGWKAIAIYKEMRWNDPVIWACLYAIEMMCRRVPWRVQPASTQPFDLEAAEYLETCMNDMSETWIDTISEIFSFLPYGYSVHEICYKRRCGDVLDPSMRSKYSDGRIGWRKLPIRSQDTIYRWQFDDHGGIQGVEQLAPPHYYHVTIPVEKMLLFRTSVEKNNPEGRSLLRGAYFSWYKKKNIENIEGIGIERDLAGLPVIECPSEILSANASVEQKALLANLKSIVINVRRDEQEGVIMPMAYDTSGKPLFNLKLLTTGGSRQFDTDKVVQRYDQRIAMTMLADFILLGHEKVGSFALASSKTNLFATALGALLDIVSDVFNRYAVPRLFALNPDFEISDYPKIMHGDTEQVDLNDLGNYIQKLSMAGFPLFPNMDLEKHLLKVANCPEPIEPETMEDMQVEAKSGTKPKKIVEIPEDDGNKLGDQTDPVNQKPGTSKAITNLTGNTETTSGIGAAAETQAALRQPRRPMGF